MDRRRVLAGGLGALAAGMAAPAFGQSVEQIYAAEALRDRALSDPTAFNLLESLTTEIGARQAGTPAGARAKDWGLAKLKAMGFSNVRAEPFPVTAWVRGAERCEVISPFPQVLHILGLGNSAPTPPAGIEAETAVFKTYDALLAAPVGSLAGKIAVCTQPMMRAQDGSGYGAMNPARRQGPSEAARRGAVAYLVRSLSTGSGPLPHTGAMAYVEGVPKIPCAALGVSDAELLDRMVRFAGDRPIRIRLYMESTSTPNAPAWNVSGEIEGSEKPDELVVIGGHLDSWDPGTGAIDDGAGVVITTAAAKLIGDLARHPKRTIRVVMFGAEETDFSGRAYAAAHRDEISKMVLAAESDSGSDRVWSLRLPVGAAQLPGLKALPGILAPLKIALGEPGRAGGSDVGPLIAQGVPSIGLRPDASRHFDWHHPAADTSDKVDPAQLNQNVAAWAACIYLIADGDFDLRTLAPPPPAAGPAR